MLERAAEEYPKLNLDNGDNSFQTSFCQTNIRSLDLARCSCGQFVLNLHIVAVDEKVGLAGDDSMVEEKEEWFESVDDTENQLKWI